MKKNYIKPTTEVCDVMLEGMIATSPGLTSTAADSKYGMEGKRRYADDEDDFFDSADIW